MSDPVMVSLVTVGLIALSAFFVIIEFALLGARRHRLEELAVRSVSARAALRGMNDLTLMLAGAQLGITACTFALGAITKPAVDAWLGPLFIVWGLADWAAGATAFALSLFIVTFLHLVIGEMAPKSWAIAHPETSALAIGVISRAYIWPLRPLLSWVNSIANRLVKARGVEPVESAAVGGQDAATIRQLVEHSAKVGRLEPELQQQLSGLIDLGTLPVGKLITPHAQLTQVDNRASVADVRKAALESGHMRILLTGHAAPPMVVHVRDTLLCLDTQPAVELARSAFVLTPDTPVYEALGRMRGSSVQLAIVMEGDSVLGIVTLADILKFVLPEGMAALQVPGVQTLEG